MKTLFLLLLGIDGYLSFSLFYPLHHDPLPFYSGIILISLLFLSISWLFFVFFKSEESTHLPYEKQLLTLAFHSMGFISFLWMVTLLRDLTAAFFYLTHSPFLSTIYDSSSTYLIFFISLILFFIGVLNAKFRLSIKKVPITLEGLSIAFESFKIVQLSDVHLGTGINLSQWKTILAKVKDLKPDLIAFTGDIIDGNVKEITAELEELRELSAPFGKFYALGNHEYYWNHEYSVSAMKQAGCTVLINENAILEKNGGKLMIAGVSDPASISFKAAKPDLENALKLKNHGLDPNLTRILLCHQPVLAEKAAENGADLMLSGHTHGGQFIPWSWLIRFAHRYHSGLSRVQNKMWIYVSHGTGYWGPPIRLGTSCEITEITLHVQTDDNGDKKKTSQYN